MEKNKKGMKNRLRYIPWCTSSLPGIWSALSSDRNCCWDFDGGNISTELVDGSDVTAIPGDAASFQGDDDLHSSLAGEFSLPVDLHFFFNSPSRWMMIPKSLPEIARSSMLLFELEALPRAVVSTWAARSDEGVTWSNLTTYLFTWCALLSTTLRRVLIGNGVAWSTYSGHFGGSWSAHNTMTRYCLATSKSAFQPRLAKITQIASPSRNQSILLTDIDLHSNSHDSFP